MTRSYEAYEDERGEIFIFALEDYRPIWASDYGCTGYEAGADWCALIVQGCDPVADGWEGFGPDEAAHLYDRPLRMIADSEATDRRPLGVHLDECGEAGEVMAVAAGAAYHCAWCGEVRPTVHDATYDRWGMPDRCECCGAPLD